MLEVNSVALLDVGAGRWGLKLICVKQTPGKHTFVYMYINGLPGHPILEANKQNKHTNRKRKNKKKGRGTSYSKREKQLRPLLQAQLLPSGCAHRPIRKKRKGKICH